MLSASQLQLPAPKFKEMGRPIELNTIQVLKEVATGGDVDARKCLELSITEHHKLDVVNLSGREEEL